MTKKAKILLHFRENYVLLRFEKRVESNYVFLIYIIMKKVFMSVAVVALMVAASACGNNAKKAEAVETEAAAVEETTTCCGDSTACCDSTKACCDSVKAE